MSSVIVLGIVLLISMLIGFLAAISINHLLIGTTFGIFLVAGTGYLSFNFLRKIGPFGYEKMLVKYFYRIDKIAGGRPIFHKIKLFWHFVENLWTLNL